MMPLRVGAAAAAAAATTTAQLLRGGAACSIGWAAAPCSCSGQAATVVAAAARLYAKQAKAGKPAAAAASARAATGPKPDDAYAPPEFRMRRVPQGSAVDAVAQMTPGQRDLLASLAPSGSGGGGGGAGRRRLRSLRQLGWPLGPRGVLSLLHDQVSDVMRVPVAITPIVLRDMFASAAGVAGVVRDFLNEGRSMVQAEQYLLTSISSLPREKVTFQGIKVQAKGRMGGNSGMTSKRVWSWGRTSSTTLADPMDYAQEAVLTRAGYVSVKVWIRYKRGLLANQSRHSSRSLLSAEQLLQMPAAPPVALPSSSSSAWWASPGPMQPRQHRPWECYSSGFDPLAPTT